MILKVLSAWGHRPYIGCEHQLLCQARVAKAHRVQRTRFFSSDSIPKSSTPSKLSFFLSTVRDLSLSHGARKRIQAVGVSFKSWWYMYHAEFSAPGFSLPTLIVQNHSPSTWASLCELCLLNQVRAPTSQGRSAPMLQKHWHHTFRIELNRLSRQIFILPRTSVPNWISWTEKCVILTILLWWRSPLVTCVPHNTGGSDSLLLHVYM